MPVTPFHFGPGLLLKAAMPARFSFTAFAAANVVIDLESFYFLLRDDWPVHRSMHTFVLASAVGLATGFLVHSLARALPQRWRAASPAAGELTLRPAILGGFTHPLLDGIMHADIQPFRPFTPDNPLHQIITTPTLHLLCIAAASIGMIALAIRMALNATAQADNAAHTRRGEE